MARTIEEINAQIISAKEAESSLNSLNSNSKTAIWRLWAYITAFAIWTLEMLFDTHRTEIDEKIRTQKSYRLPWYREMALLFQYGDDFKLVPGFDFYDNTGKDLDAVENSKIIKYSAVDEVEGVLILKIATEENGELKRITNEQEQTFTYYINKVKPGGVEVRIINAEPDLLNLEYIIYYDPILMNSDGNLINPNGAGDKPVELAIKQYLKKLPFNGELVLAHLTDYLQLVKGVAIPELLLASSKWVNDTDFVPINVKVIPNSGYFKLLAENLKISYVPNI